MNAADSACTNACTSESENGNAEGPDGASGAGADRLALIARLIGELPPADRAALVAMLGIQ